MTRPPALTDKQIQAIRDNLDTFPSNILKLPEFKGTEISRHTVRNYQLRMKREIERMTKRRWQHTSGSIYPDMALNPDSTDPGASPDSYRTSKNRSKYARTARRMSNQR